MPTRSLPVLALALALALAGCGAANTGVTDGDDPVGVWSLATAEPDLGIPLAAAASLEVGNRGTASGQTPCNDFAASVTWSADGGWVLGEVSVEDGTCDPDLVTARAAYLDALTGADRWRVVEDTLELRGDTTLTFARVSPDEGGGD